MEYIKFGNTGMDISPICLGCMSFGHPTEDSWFIAEEPAREIVRKALDMGINFFDTANVYAQGRSEEILGQALKDFAKREEIVIATKVNGQMFAGPNNQGLSRKTIMREVEESLKRLQTDYIDLYIIHRWDYHTPIEETMETLNDLVRSGKVRYIGASAMYAWQFQKAQNIAEKRGWAKFVSMQNHYNLLYREEEREMLPYCRDAKIASTPYSPLASGRLVRDWSETTRRLETDKIAKSKYDSTAIQDKEIVERVAKLAEQKSVTRLSLSLAWLRHKDPVVAPIIGITKVEQLDGVLEFLDITLTAEEMLYLEEPYVPHAIVGHF